MDNSLLIVCVLFRRILAPDKVAYPTLNVQAEKRARMQARMGITSQLQRRERISRLPCVVTEWRSPEAGSAAPLRGGTKELVPKKIKLDKR
jgi:hypothetical protein